MANFKKHFLVLLFAVIAFFYACEMKEEISIDAYELSSDIKAESYVCHHTSQQLNIDGQDLESDWKSAQWTRSFVDIEGDHMPHPTFDTKVKMLWDSNYFYVFAKLEEAHIWATLKNRDDIIFHDDDFEIFIDPDGDSHNYYELEWNAFNTLWDLILLRPYRADQKPKVLFEWNVTDIKSAVHIEGTLNDNSDVDKFWSIEIAIPWFALKELTTQAAPPNDGDQWRINFSRVDWTVENDGIIYKKSLDKNGKVISENNWVWSPTGRINMHMPEMWGFVQFSDRSVGSETTFDYKPDEQIKIALWDLYWQQLDYHKTHGNYTSALENFTIPEIRACMLNPKIYTTPYSFEITSESCTTEGIWKINHEGKVELI